MKRPPRIMISAGEASGDRLGAGLARAILARRPDAEILGMGGDEMIASGVRVVQDASEIAVMGVVEVISHLSTIRRAMARLESIVESEKPDILVPIDFPDFNLRLAARATRNGVPVVYFVSPQVWAWRAGRVDRMGKLVRRVLVVFPFETEIYERAGVPVTFVGHPVVERFGESAERASLLRSVGLDPGREVVALLPGSRHSEIDRILGRLLDAARILRARRPGVQFVLPRASTLEPQALARPLERSGLEDAVVSDSELYPEILTACTVGAVTSGTASLESAVAGLPMVVVYRTHPLTYLL
ncbi:MAG: lipid-A-disaccharide synthase, partial [Acidobacteriota bacterium]|nr:lipid-A-disaccharide synthase [Acidobacteriota bacterium]